VKKLLFIFLLVGCTSTSNMVDVVYHGNKIKSFDSIQTYNQSMQYSDVYKSLLEAELNNQIEVFNKSPQLTPYESVYSIPVKIEWSNKDKKVLKVITLEVLFTTQELPTLQKKDKILDVNFVVTGKFK